MNWTNLNTVMLPKIEEKFHEEAKIQDFCASLDLTQEDENKKKLEVRPVDQVVGDGARALRKPKLGTTINNTKQNPTAVKRFKEGFSKAQLYGVLTRKAKNRKNATELQQNKLIDLTKFDDAKLVANSLMQDLRDYDAKRIQSHLNRFENADLTFPKLWNKEELFRSANSIAHDEPRIAHSTVQSARSLTSMPNRTKQLDGQCQKEHSNVYKREDLIGRQFYFGYVFYSKPVSLKNANRVSTEKLLSLRTQRACGLSLKLDHLH